ncbi:hypothetical protein A2209_00435 [Candidatus Roizmanbacteria bacterium RIFOXYA1_FULL_41_12]|uniref:Uncharacterized protein n=1 Tax=Candidatus Roizmanbacteria bacterium RIFOXYA1_FULL_41_12 TaxID=1802082 RepID=A0A1F7KB13_9BACT|nr:MAG: hypothetical protein A2209_00435 [Candidatus Roizmanbacteria bacterium RIFOXYA1_FULL_41_12]
MVIAMKEKVFNQGPLINMVTGWDHLKMWKRHNWLPSKQKERLYRSVLIVFIAKLNHTYKLLYYENSRDSNRTKLFYHKIMINKSATTVNEKK